MTAFVQEAVARRDPSVAAPAPAEPATPSVEEGHPVARADAFASLADVDAALGSALAYFETMEPSSAAVLLIGQTRQLLGKNLYEVMKILTPTYADNARVFVGSDAAFTVPISNIAAANQEAAVPAVEQRAFAPAPTRAAALVLIESVAAHMRATEPSSPAPYLLDRAKALASRDFLSLLKDLLSEDALSNLKRGD
jgi:type VI secretion system protein ImpA